MAGCTKASRSELGFQSILNLSSIPCDTNMEVFFLFSQGARKIVHELIFCSMLMETEFKRQFAIEFTKVNKERMLLTYNVTIISPA